MSKRNWTIDGFTLIIIVAILAGVINQFIERKYPKPEAPKEKAVVVEMNEGTAFKPESDKVKFFDGIVQSVDLDEAYEPGDTVLVERK